MKWTASPLLIFLLASSFLVGGCSNSMLISFPNASKMQVKLVESERDADRRLIRYRETDLDPAPVMVNSVGSQKQAGRKSSGPSRGKGGGEGSENILAANPPAAGDRLPSRIGPIPALSARANSKVRPESINGDGGLSQETLAPRAIVIPEAAADSEDSMFLVRWWHGVTGWMMGDAAKDPSSLTDSSRSVAEAPPVKPRIGQGSVLASGVTKPTGTMRRKSDFTSSAPAGVMAGRSAKPGLRSGGPIPVKHDVMAKMDQKSHKGPKGLVRREIGRNGHVPPASKVVQAIQGRRVAPAKSHVVVADSAS